MRRRRSGDKLSATSNVPLARLKGHVYIEQKVLSIKSNHGDLLRGVRGLCILPPLKKIKKNPTLILNKAPRPSSKQISPRTQFRLVGEPAPPNRTPAACALCAGAMVKPLGSLNQGYCKHVRGLSIFITRSAGEDTRTTSTVYLLTVRLARQKHSTSRR